MKKENKYKVIIVLIVSIEILFGGLLVFKKYQENFKQTQTAKITTINKSKIEQINNDELKYYWKYNPNQKLTDNPYWLKKEINYKINNDGLNDLSDYSIEKSKDSFRIITLGDSFTFGHFVNTKDNWTEVLETELNKNLPCGYKKFEVINLGMPGFDIEYIVRRYKDLGTKYNPDLIIWFESGTGFTRFNEMLNPLKELCIEIKEETIRNENKDDKTEEELEEDFIKDKYEFHHYCYIKAEDQVLKRYNLEERLAKIKELYNSYFLLTKNTETLFFNFNYDKEIVEYFTEIYPETKFIANIYHKDIERLEDGHPNEQGHRTIANSIYEYLINSENICN